jgi:hypothetical protein
MTTSSDSRPNRQETPAPSSSARSPAAVTATAWSPRVELTVADWVCQGRWLGALGRGSGWWIGDWVRYGNARYGDRYAPAARVTGYDVQSLRNMAYVAGRFDVQRRRGGLSFSHHAELAGLPAEEQDIWLDRAEVGALSVGSLRSELRHARHRVASRVALADARRERRGKLPVARPKTAIMGRDVEPPAFPHGATGPRIAVTGPQPIAAELVCPECGHHFAAAPSGVAAQDHRRGPSVGVARLALLPQAESGTLPPA